VLWALRAHPFLATDKCPQAERLRRTLDGCATSLRLVTYQVGGELPSGGVSRSPPCPGTDRPG
jgi:hypothetical protein